MKKLARSWESDYFPEVFSYEHLYESYKKCRCGVSWKGSVQKFISQAPLQTYRIWKELDDGTWKSKGFYSFNVVERGKLRHIQSVTMSERIVQKCLCDHALVPVLQPTFIYDNSASTKNKGYHFAIGRCEKHLHDHFRKYGQEGYVLVFDFSKYFENISHEVVEKIVKRNFTDRKLVGLLMYLVRAFGDIGLGLGSQISQVFALAVPGAIDHYIKDQLGVHGYGRYMDDGYILSDSKDFLVRCLESIKRICGDLGIKLNAKKTRIIKLSKGFTFLKCRFFLTKTGKVIKKIYKLSVTRMRRKLKKFAPMVEAGILTNEDVYQAFQSWRAYADHFDAWHTVQNMTKLYNSLFLSPAKTAGFFWGRKPNY